MLGRLYNESDWDCYKEGSDGEAKIQFLEEESESMNQTIHARLTQVAQSRDLISYSETGDLVDLNMASPADRNKLSELLDEINQVELDQGRPMLSSVVVYADDPKTPGPGFFACARGLGKLTSRDSIDELAFWASEVKTVHEYWSTNPTNP